MKKYTIRCDNKNEMNRIAGHMAAQGYSVKTAEGILPVPSYGVCIPVYNVIFWKEQKEGKAANRPYSLKKVFEEKLSWISGLRKTSALSESSAR